MTESNINQLGFIKNLLTAVVVKTPYEEVEGLVEVLQSREEYGVRCRARDDIERRLVPYILQALSAKDDCATDRLLQAVWSATYRLRAEKTDADVQMLHFFQQHDVVLDELRQTCGFMGRSFERAFGFIADAWIGTSSAGMADLALDHVFRCYDFKGDYASNGSHINRMIVAQFLRACKTMGHQQRISDALRYLTRHFDRTAARELRGVLLNAYVRAGIGHIGKMLPVLQTMEDATLEEMDELLAAANVIVRRRKELGKMLAVAKASLMQFHDVRATARERNWKVIARLPFAAGNDQDVEKRSQQVTALIDQLAAELNHWLNTNGHADKYLLLEVVLEGELYGRAGTVQRHLGAFQP